MAQKLEITVIELAPPDFPPEVKPTAEERVSVYLRVGGRDAAWKRCDHKIAKRAQQLGCPFVMRTGFVGDGLLVEAGYHVNFYQENPVPQPYNTYSIF